MPDDNLSQMEKLDVSPNLIYAYLMNMSKSIILVAAVIGVFYFLEYVAGSNPFLTVFEILTIPIEWVMRGVIVCIAVYFALTFFDTLSLTSYELIFEGDLLSYSYGNFLKKTESTKIANITNVNFKEYAPFKIGEINVELTGTEEKDIKVRYVKSAKGKADLINKLVALKKAELAEEIRERGVVA